MSLPKMLSHLRPPGQEPRVPMPPQHKLPQQPLSLQESVAALENQNASLKVLLEASEGERNLYKTTIDGMAGEIKYLRDDRDHRALKTQADRDYAIGVRVGFIQLRDELAALLRRIDNYIEKHSMEIPPPQEEVIAAAADQVAEAALRNVQEARGSNLSSADAQGSEDGNGQHPEAHQRHDPDSPGPPPGFLRQTLQKGTDQT